jgi:hypothetical protein
MSSSQSAHVIIQNVQAVFCILQSEICIKYDNEHAVSIPWKICTINEFRQHNKASAISITETIKRRLNLDMHSEVRRPSTAINTAIIKSLKR